MSLMKALNGIGPSTDPLGTPLVSVFHMDTELWTVALWLNSHIQFLIHLTVHPSNISLQVSSKDMWDCIKGLTCM